MRSLIVIVAVTASACVADGHADQTNQPARTEYRVISGDLQGAYPRLIAVEDSAKGVTCYTRSYYTISCVKTGSSSDSR